MSERVSHAQGEGGAGSVIQRTAITLWTQGDNLKAVAQGGEVVISGTSQAGAEMML
jgi:hypothetical protein